MRVLLICAGGVSSTLVMKKIEKAAEADGSEIYINATSLAGYESDAPRYDIIALAPQVRYKEAEIKNRVNKPIVEISVDDYKNCDGFKIYQMLKEKRKEWISKI